MITPLPTSPLKRREGCTNDMQAVILAAGLGSRMGKLTRNTPKLLLKIEEKTLLEHNLTALPDEIDEVILVVGYLKDQIKDFIGDNFLGKKIAYVEQKELLGTGHALAQCKGILHNRFLVLMGDDLYYEKDLEQMLQYPLSMLVKELKEDYPGSKFAHVIMDKEGHPLDIQEKQPGRKGSLVNCGAYVLDERYFDLPLILAGNQTSEYGLPQTMLQLVKQGLEIKLVKASFWHNVTFPEDLQVKSP